jgi:hypothetical protein
MVNNEYEEWLILIASAMVSCILKLFNLAAKFQLATSFGCGNKGA